MRPAPLMPPDVNLKDFTYLPIDIVRLFNSEFHARSSDSEWRAGMTLWLKSIHQVPAGSIPDEDVPLARLAEFGRDVKSWQDVKAGALHGWVICTDDRWYHPVVCEKALEGWIGKLLQRRSGTSGNAKRWGNEPDFADVDQQILLAATALQKLAPGSSILRKCPQITPLPQGTPATSDEPIESLSSQPDTSPIATPSQPDREPIAEGSHRITIGTEHKRESRACATTPSLIADEPKPSRKRGRSPKSLIPWPPDFALTAELREYATKRGFDGNWLFEKFKNKALSKGWTYKDWPAAFRNFAQTEQSYVAASRPNGGRQDQAWRPGGDHDAIRLRDPCRVRHPAALDDLRQSQNEVSPMLTNPKTQARPLSLRDDQARQRCLALPQLRLAGRAIL